MRGRYRRQIVWRLNSAQIKASATARQLSLFSLDARGRQLKGWTNKLIWGDNKLILSSLKNGPLREEIEKQGGLKLIYIDPPFDVGADFSMDIEIGGDTFTKKPNILEEIAYLTPPTLTVSCNEAPPDQPPFKRNCMMYLRRPQY